MNPTDLEQFQLVAREFRRIADEIQKTRGVMDNRLLAIANSIDVDVSKIIQEPSPPAARGRKR